MTAPRHLWSGDWRRESAEAAEELARRKAPPEEPPAPPRPAPPRPRTMSAAARALAHLRGLRPSAAVVMIVAVLLAAGVGYAAVSLVTGGSSASGNPPLASTSGQSSAPGWLGVQTMTLSPAIGVMVVDVVPGSPAHQAGLEQGDVITEIGNQPVRAPSDVESALSGTHAGQQVLVEYDRGPVLHTTQVTLRARPGSGP